MFFVYVHYDNVLVVFSYISALASSTKHTARIQQLQSGYSVGGGEPLTPKNAAQWRMMLKHGI